MGNPYFIVKPYNVSAPGATVRYIARSPGQARSKAWRDYTHCDDRCTFGDFMKISTVRRAPYFERFGEAIIVCGEPAYWVGDDGQYVKFVRPGSDVVLSSHPLDVERVNPN